MKKLLLTILMVFCITGLVNAQEAWYEAAESCAENYEVNVSRDIPAEPNAREDIKNIDKVEVNIIDTTDMEEPEAQTPSAEPPAGDLAKDEDPEDRSFHSGPPPRMRVDD